MDGQMDGYMDGWIEITIAGRGRRPLDIMMTAIMNE